MPDVLEQIPRRHLLRYHEQDRQDVRGQHGCPFELGQFEHRRPRLGKLRLDYFLQLPCVVAQILSPRRKTYRRKTMLLIEFINADSTSELSWRTSRTLTNRSSSFTHRPLRNSCASPELVARSFNMRAAFSAAGVTSSPTAKVMMTMTMPMPDSRLMMLAGDSPDPRMTVNAEFAA